MRVVCAIISIIFLLIGGVLMHLSLSDEDIGLNTARAFAAAFGFGLVGVSTIIILLVCILNELMNNSLTPKTGEDEG